MANGWLCERVVHSFCVFAYWLFTHWHSLFLSYFLLFLMAKERNRCCLFYGRGVSQPKLKHWLSITWYKTLQTITEHCPYSADGFYSLNDVCDFIICMCACGLVCVYVFSLLPFVQMYSFVLFVCLSSRFSPSTWMFMCWYV